MEKKQTQFSKSISGLPTYSPKDQVWERILYILEFPIGLSESVKSKLPVHQSKDSWAAIEQVLNAAGDDPVLSKAIETLPKYTLGKDLFHQSIPTAKTRQLILPRGVQLSIAASIILLVSLGFMIWSLLNKPKIEYTYREEVVQPPLADLGQAFHQEDNILQFIKSNCSAYSLKCREPEFLGLLDQYQELQKAEQKLSQEILQNNNSTQLTKYLIRITKEKSEVGKSLINYLIS